MLENPNILLALNNTYVRGSKSLGQQPGQKKHQNCSEQWAA